MTKKWVIIVIVLVVASVIAIFSGVIPPLPTEQGPPESIHIVTLCWPLEHIEARGVVGGYVATWYTPTSIHILQVDVWMGNPYTILWEGDVIVTMSNATSPTFQLGGISVPQHLWHPAIDEALVHYQFDSHSPSPLPHLISFNLRPGFHVHDNKPIYVYRLFNSFDEQATDAGDGWIVIYYLEG